MGWIQSVHQENSGNGVVNGLNTWRVWLTQVTREYLMATLYVTQVFLMRVTILMLSIPLFVLTALVGIVDGIVRRDLRRYGAGYESSFLSSCQATGETGAVYSLRSLFIGSFFRLSEHCIITGSTADGAGYLGDDGEL